MTFPWIDREIKKRQQSGLQAQVTRDIRALHNAKTREELAECVDQIGRWLDSSPSHREAYCTVHAQVQFTPRSNIRSAREGAQQVERSSARLNAAIVEARKALLLRAQAPPS